MLLISLHTFYREAQVFEESIEPEHVEIQTNYHSFERQEARFHFKAMQVHVGISYHIHNNSKRSSEHYRENTVVSRPEVTM